MKKVPIRVLGTIFLLAIIAAYLLIQQLVSMFIGPRELNIAIPKEKEESSSVSISCLDIGLTAGCSIEPQFCLTFDNDIN